MGEVLEVVWRGIGVRKCETYESGAQHTILLALDDVESRVASFCRDLRP